MSKERYSRNREYHAAYREKHKVRRQAQIRARNQRLKEAGLCVRCKTPTESGKTLCAGCNARHVQSARKRHTGCTPEHFARLLHEQEGRCAICAELFTRTPNADHDHDTKTVRGLLCNSCNRGIGYLKDSPDIAARAEAYLRLHKGA